jgi:RNase P subunit RPR2
MSQGKCEILISSISDSEWKKFQKIIPDKLLPIAVAYRKGEHFDKKPVKLRKLEVELSRLLERFIISSRFEHEPVSKLIELARYCYEQNTDKLFHHYISQAEHLLSKQNSTLKNSRFNYEIYQLKLNFLEKTNRWKDAPTALKNLEKALGYNHFLESCDFLAALLHAMHTGVADFQEPDINFLIERTQKLERYASTPLAKMYVAFIRLLQNRNIEGFKKYRNTLFSDTLLELGNDEQQYFLNVSENMIVKEVNTGNLDFENELLLFLEFCIKNKLYYFNQHIHFASFLNLMAITLRFKKFEWAELFMKEVIKNIPLEQRENALRFSKGLFHWFKEEYADSLRWFSLVTFEHTIYKMHVRHMTMKALYKLKEFESLKSAMESFRVFLYRNKELSTLHRQNFGNFLFYLNKLLSSIGKPKKFLQKIKKDIEQEEVLAECFEKLV